MPVFRVKKNNNYSTMSNYHFKEKEMTLKAKGLLSLMLSLPNDWDYTEIGLSKLSKDSIDATRSALNELEKFGYLIRKQSRNNLGKFSNIEYLVYEQPYLENPITDNPITEKPIQLNTNIINNINNKNNEQSSKQKDRFDEIWDCYPRKEGKKIAYDTYLKYIGNGKKVNGKIVKLTNKQIGIALNKYLDDIEERKVEIKYIAQGSTFFNSKIFDYL